MYKNTFSLKRLPKFYLLLAFWVCSDTALGASVETLVMPGPLSEAHAHLENQCGSCHIRFDQAGQDNLCLECHEPIAEDINKNTGFHGRHPTLTNQTCNSCHTDHQGREKDISGLVFELFDHSLTDFPLQGLHEHTACNECHTDDQPFRETGSNCSACHAQISPHTEDLTPSCDACHESIAWTNISFDHSVETTFALQGKHGDLACGSCHQDNTFQSTASTCASCHAVDDIHNGANGNQCSNCHSEQNWDVKFDHDTQTDFALLGAHSALSCAACHSTELAIKPPSQSCIGCHSADDIHQGGNGNQCESCHNNSNWATQFDHLEETGFALKGSHTNLSCKQCHTQSIKDPIEPACYACHVKDDPHEGTLGTCEECHGEQNWSMQIRFHHDLTAFPLLGSHKLTACEQCHSTMQFNHTAGQDCVACHNKDNTHGKTLGQQCGVCHTPVAWTMWQFDHSEQTSFELTGAHEGLECNACHISNNPANTPALCAGCHRKDDPHKGNFGTDCLRCHTTKTFTAPNIRRSP